MKKENKYNELKRWIKEQSEYTDWINIKVLLKKIKELEKEVE